MCRELKSSCWIRAFLTDMAATHYSSVFTADRKSYIISLICICEQTANTETLKQYLYNSGELMANMSAIIPTKNLPSALNASIVRLIIYTHNRTHTHR